MLENEVYSIQGVCVLNTVEFWVSYWRTPFPHNALLKGNGQAQQEKEKLTGNDGETAQKDTRQQQKTSFKFSENISMSVWEV